MSGFLSTSPIIISQFVCFYTHWLFGHGFFFWWPPLVTPTFFLVTPRGWLVTPKIEFLVTPRCWLVTPKIQLLVTPGVDWWPPKIEKIKKSNFDQIFFQIWLSLRNIFKICIFDFQYQIIDLIRVSSIFWFFYKMWSRPIFMARFMWSKTACICIKIRLESKNKCWDLKDLITNVLFHIHIIAIWRIFKEIEVREKNFQIFMWVNLLLFDTGTFI